MIPLNLKSHQKRSELFFILVLASLYLPFFFSSLFLTIFVIHSFFTKGFTDYFKKSDLYIILPFAGYFAVSAISLLYSQDIQTGWAKVQTKLPFLLMPIVIVGSGISKSPSFRQKVLKAFIMITILAAVATLLNAAYSSWQAGSFTKVINDDGSMVKQYYFTYTNLAFFIMHPAYFSIYVGCAIFVLLYLLISKTKLFHRVWQDYLALAFLFIFMLLLQGRMSIIAFCGIFFISVLVYFFSRKEFKKGSLLIFGPSVLLVLIFALAPHNVTRRFTEFNSYSYNISAPSVYDFNGFTIRLAEWECAWEVVKEHPIFGTGVGDANKALQESYKDKNFVVGLKRSYNSHNQYFETTLQSGIIGLLFLIWMAVALISRSYREKDMLLFAVTGLFFASMVTEALLERQWANGFYCSLILFIALSAPWTTTSEADK